MHKNVRANARIGKREPDGVIDVPHSQFVGTEEQGCNGEAGSVGACALIPAPRRRVYAIEIPNRYEIRANGILGHISLEGFV
jgi:hypothetical protein